MAGQVAISVIVALICAAVIGAPAGLAALVGGGIGVAASIVQVAASFRRTTTDPRAIARGFYRGEALKIAVTVLLFIVALRRRSLPPGPLFAGYVATFAAYWVALAQLAGRRAD